MTIQTRSSSRSANRPKTRATPGKLLNGDPNQIIRQNRKALRDAQRKAELETIIAPVDSSYESCGVENNQRVDWDSSAFNHNSFEFPPPIDEDTESNIASSDTDSEDPWEAWYRDIGYLPPLDESTIQLLSQITSDPAMGRINPTDKDNFQDGLEERNVALKPFTDPYIPSIKQLTSKAEQESQEEKIRHDNAWRRDLEKSKDDPDEPIFQRTIMMSMIDRHRFIYRGGEDRKRKFDFSVEKAWTCPPMPTRVSIDQESNVKFLTQPKPDLAIAFCKDYLFPKHWESLPPATKQIICYEGKGRNKRARAFHFMTIEGKNSYTNANDEVAFLQSLNNASQSLHNLYEFFNEAGEEHVKVFFSQVRFFSVVSCMAGIKIRIHRACRVEKHRDKDAQADDAGQVDQPKAKDPIFKDYPLQFEHDDYFSADNTEFTRDNVVRVFEHIVVGYGEVLSGLLRNAADAVTEKCKNFWEARNQRLPRGDGWYSHGQKPPPARSVTSRVTQQSLESTMGFEQSNKRRRH
ncbi:hypothetical protein F4680DRAFT_441735, partial [Xylaria scruposa]